MEYIQYINRAMVLRWSYVFFSSLARLCMTDDQTAHAVVCAENMGLEVKGGIPYHIVMLAAEIRAKCAN